MDARGSRALVDTVAFIATHPQRGGIGAFSAALAAAVESLDVRRDCTLVAVSDGEQGPPLDALRCGIEKTLVRSYVHAAHFLNRDDVDVVCLQYGLDLYGGEAGAHVLALLRLLKMPIVTTLHDVVSPACAAERAVMAGVCAASRRLIVMTGGEASTLQLEYRVALEKIDVIARIGPTALEKSRSGSCALAYLCSFQAARVEHEMDARELRGTAGRNAPHVPLAQKPPLVLRTSLAAPAKRAACDGDRAAAARKAAAYRVGGG